ncbi:MAG: purine-nucleoside phosphorylase [Flavobacteriaceae bacterium]
MKTQHLQDTLTYLKDKITIQPELGIVLGTGLGQIVQDITISHEIAYADIPHFPKATVEFHSGKLIFGTLEGKNVVVMSGRFHLYEGYDFWQVTYGIRTLHGLGITKLLVSNAAGAINLNYKKGDLMVIDDHINLQGGSPLAFANVNEFGSQFTDMLAPYSKHINTQLKTIAQQHGITLHEGVYASVVGPQLETRAEYRMLGILGADAVGMSTVPEVIVANHLDLEVAAISVLTDECDPDNLQPVNIAEIIAVAGEAEPKMITLFKALINVI